MNKKTGKHLVLYGLLLSFVILAVTVLLYYFRLFLNLSIPRIFESIFIILNVASNFLVVTGFLVVFLSDRKLLDLLITFAFIAAYALNFAQSTGLFNPYAYGEVAAIKAVNILTFVTLIPYALWFMRLLKTTSVGAISVVLSVLVALFVPSMIATYFSPADEMFLLLTVILNVVICALRTFAAFLDTKTLK